MPAEPLREPDRIVPCAVCEIRLADYECAQCGYAVCSKCLEEIGGKLSPPTCPNCDR